MTTFPESRCREIVRRIAKRKLVRWLRENPQDGLLTDEEMTALWRRAFIPYATAKLLKRLWARGHAVEFR